MSVNKFLKAPRFCSRSCRTSIQSLPRKSKGKENSTRILAVRNVELVNSKKSSKTKCSSTDARLKMKLELGINTTVKCKKSSADIGGKVYLHGQSEKLGALKEK